MPEAGFVWNWHRGTIFDVCFQAGLRRKLSVAVYFTITSISRCSCHNELSLFAKSGLIPRRKLVCAYAAAQIRQRLQKFGIKPDGIINFFTE
jgi:hypothetical protein